MGGGHVVYLYDIYLLYTHTEGGDPGCVGNERKCVKKYQGRNFRQNEDVTRLPFVHRAIKMSCFTSCTEHTLISYWGLFGL